MARLSTLLLVAACLATTTFCLAADEVEYEFTDSKGEVAGQPKITKGKRPAEDDGERAAADSDRNATGDARPRKRLEAEEVMVNVRRISVYPAVFLIGKFLETSTTEHFRKLAAAELQAAGTSGMTPDGTEIEDSMQRQTMWLSDEQMAADDLVVATAKRVKDMLRRVVSDQNDVPDERKWLKVYATNVSYGGNFQVSKYGAGSYYKAHTDFRAPQMSSAEAFGDRVTTFVTFLEDVPKGGHIAFPFVKWDKSLGAGQWVGAVSDLQGIDCAKRDGACKRAHNSSGFKHDQHGMAYCCCKQILRVQPQAGDALLYFPASADGQEERLAVTATCPPLGKLKGQSGNLSSSVLQQWFHRSDLNDINTFQRMQTAEAEAEADGLSVGEVEARRREADERQKELLKSKATEDGGGMEQQELKEEI